MKEKILRNLENLLDEYGYTYTDHALKKIVDEWYEQKMSIRNVLRNHPNWIEDEDMIVFDVSMSRGIDKKVIQNFRTWILNTFEIKCQNYNAIWRNDLFPCEQFVTEEMLGLIKVDYPDFKGAVGQKTSRAMNKLFCMLGFDKHPDYNREFAKYADALNPLTITRHTIISINLIDYLTMSFGNSWASCHTIDKTNKRGMPNSYSGCYSSGTLSYGLDPSSIVFYTVDADYNGNEFYFEPKINRQMFHFGEDKLVQGRLYPQSCDFGFGDSYTQFRNIMQGVFAQCLGVPNLWILKTGTGACYDAIIDGGGTNYKDYYHFDQCNVSILKNSENENRIEIGAEPICIECGYRHGTEQNINCCRSRTCEHCGCAINEDDAHYVDGEYYCDDCVTWCECCDSYVLNDDATWIDSEDRYVCNDCLDEYYSYCDECGNYYNNDDGRYVDYTDSWVCGDCLDERYTQCEECGEYYPNYRIVTENFHDYCEDCLEEIRRENENEEEEDNEYDEAI